MSEWDDFRDMGSSTSTISDSFYKKGDQLGGPKSTKINDMMRENNSTNWIGELAKLEKRRIGLHEYIIMKLDEHDYHAIQDAGSDLRELDARSKAIREWIEGK